MSRVAAFRTYRWGSLVAGVIVSQTTTDHGRNSQPRFDRWIDLVEGRGQGAIRNIYLETLSGKARPDQQHILSVETSNENGPIKARYFEQDITFNLKEVLCG
jgi:hypothetical protein